MDPTRFIAEAKPRRKNDSWVDGIISFDDSSAELATVLRKDDEMNHIIHDWKQKQRLE